MTPSSATHAPVLSLRSASFGYPDRTVVHDLDLQIRPGEVVALLGPNGSGKSTLVRGLLGLTQLRGGHVDLLGAPLGQLAQRHRVGYVPQRHTLAGSVAATVAEVTLVGRLPHLRWWARPGRADRAIAAEALRRVGLADRARAEVSTLSGGQQRRVLIARALAAEPELLIMDEPTAGVDEASQQILAKVLAHVATGGSTILIVTHELAALKNVVGRVVELHSGRVCFDGTPAQYAHHRQEQLAPEPHHDEEGPEPHLPSAGPWGTRREGRR